MMFSDNEIKKFRNETPGCNTRTHLNNAGAALMPACVIDAMTKYLSLEGEVGGYEAADLESEAINEFYKVTARLLNCKAKNIAFTNSATDSFIRAVSSIPFKAGDTILTSNEDYISNQIAFLSLQKRIGIEVVRVKSNSEGDLDLTDLEKCLQKHSPKLVSITHIPTNSGLIQPVKKIGEVCNKYDTIYLIDACQSIGQLALDVNELQCDFLSVTNRKFLRGPRGAGFLYVSDRVLTQGYEPLFIDMRGARWIEENTYEPAVGAQRFEDWEFNYSSLVGSSEAIKYLLQLDLDKVEQRVKHLSQYLRAQLSEIPNVQVLDVGSELGGIVTFGMGKGRPEEIKQMLFNVGINVVTSYREFAVIDFDRKGVEWAIRASPHYYNTTEEVEQLALEIKKFIEKT